MTALWYERTGGERGAWTGIARTSDDHDDGAVVDDPGSVAPVVWRTSATARGMVRIEVPGIDAAPPVWFVHVDEPRAAPPATNLVAFAAEGVAAGTVLDHYAFASLGVPNDEQVGAIRWHPDDGLVHQMFVAERWRRHRVGSVLIYAADAVHFFRGWRGRLHGDGRRTELGEQFLAAQRHPERVAERTHIMPPMDPRT